MEIPSADLKAALSGSEEERLETARYLRRDPRPDLLQALQQARAIEKVRWVRIALDEAIDACEGKRSHRAASHLALQENSDARQAYEDGRSDGLRQALHEVSPIVGLARAAADDGDQDEVQRQLDRLRAVCSGLRGFLHALSPREFREFDLSSIPRGLAESPPIDCPEGILTARGISPLLVRGDPDLLQLALRPIVINAIEAVCSLGDPESNTVTISWGLERDTCWIVVIDRGPGLDPQLDPATSGGSTKEGHIGFGLATAHAAMNSLGGKVEVAGNRHGGATVLLEWQGAL
jgi:signal transduction histidine kinase